MNVPQQNMGLQVIEILLANPPFLVTRASQFGGANEQLADNNRICGSRACKPNSVCWITPAGRPFLWARHCCRALATYPKVERAEPARVPPVP
jgi:hypothetical protein